MKSENQKPLDPNMVRYFKTGEYYDAKAALDRMMDKRGIMESFKRLTVTVNKPTS